MFVYLFIRSHILGEVRRRKETGMSYGYESLNGTTYITHLFNKYAKALFYEAKKNSLPHISIGL